VCFFAARNLSPHPAIFHAMRQVLNVMRGINEIILALIFVAAVGLGPFAGVIAMAIHGAGMLGKFFAEAIEHADPGPAEAVRAAGAGRLQVVLHGILPQAAPQMMDTVFYRWEYNFRASTVMGMVGAGGIGFELMGSLRIMQYQEVAAILLVILAMVTLVDASGAWLRRRWA
ncbi:MAG: phosphonate ABC transporter, permease protein PhnE, partial [Planctomycetes bacterium]|nr:phosphonate ABC transporter, permease protein PhnE [Planctomycetota bacterium]